MLKEHKWILVSKDRWSEEKIEKVNSEIKDGTFVRV